MKKMLFLGVLTGLVSCDDGDLQIEQVDFEEVNIQSCPGLDDPTETTFFFKIDGDEALLLNLAAGLIKNETSAPGTLQSTIPEPSNLVYRLFSDDVTEAYFCDAVPPLEPTVINENTATAGDITINTRVDTLTADTKNYAHTISIDNLSLVNDQGEQLTDLSTLVYGNFISQTRNSARLEVPFSNYADVETQRCAPAPIEGALRLNKVLNDEFIALDVPDAEAARLFGNIATPDTTRTLNLSAGEVFKYVVLDTVVNNDLACTDIFDGDISSWRFVSTAGTLKVKTVAGVPDANGSISYTHTITLEDLVLTSANLTDVKEVSLAPIPQVKFGTYITTVE
ncbi:MAG TPA: hypothetical protein VFM69_10505 [Pricia sp.]|nr:hypothetical protein [Pricia sp.]